MNMKRIFSYAFLSLCPFALSASVFTQIFTADTTWAELEAEGWSLTDDAVTANSLSFSADGMKLENLAGGFHNLRSPSFTPASVGSATLTFAAAYPRPATHGRFVLMGGGFGGPDEVVRLELQNNNTTLRVNDDNALVFMVPNFNIEQDGQFLNIDLEWDGEFVDIYVNNDLITTVGYRNAGLSPDRFEFVAGWSGAANVAVASTGVTVIPEPSAYAALFGAFFLGMAWLRRRSKNG